LLFGLIGLVHGLQDLRVEVYEEYVFYVLLFVEVEVLLYFLGFLSNILYLNTYIRLQPLRHLLSHDEELL
jgi:hypothetical protein